MAFDQTTRNRLARFVAEARSLLAAEFTRQLQLDFAMDPRTGEVGAIEKLTRLDGTRLETARVLRDTLEHYLAAVPSPRADVPAQTPSRTRVELLDRIVREQAFTVLDRLCALRMAEARGLLLESVGRGYQSRGFQLYARLAGPALGETGDAYRCYLFSVFDELAVDLPVLFDRFSQHDRLFPREKALLDLLALINDPEIEPLWVEDETLGWIYQYFNSKEERKTMRDASAAPRNSRELAVRNQFFTPRYVVEFLTDNTLGRTWYEMTRGETALRDTCRYLVRRPHEIFLEPGQTAPLPAETTADAPTLDQAALLQQPVYIPHRPLKDPRDLRLLDPACGSMHFGLYAFDLFEQIYAEAWDLEHARGPEAFERSEGLSSLHQTYPDHETFLQQVPRLIIERNIHGIDIDARAVQIAGLSLWLRAQKRWLELGLSAAKRPPITRSNIVCAEPMPGEESFLREFLERQLSATPEQRLLGQLVKRVFEAMKLAGEAGSLLKIEEEIAGDVAEAKQRWGSVEQQVAVFRRAAGPGDSGTLDVSGITDAAFWSQAEQRIYTALEQYAEQAGTGTGYQRRLFAGDAARGFAFIEVCRKRYDVVLMNPPFGAGSLGAKQALEKAYPRTKNDLYAAIVERGVNLLHPHGQLGALTSRTGFFLSSFQKWREEILLREAPPTLLADLGTGVLDNAMVEVAAYCLEKIAPTTGTKTVFIRALEADDKTSALLEGLHNPTDSRRFEVEAGTFSMIPNAPFAYWVSNKLRRIFDRVSPVAIKDRTVRQGLATANDFRFLRLKAEAPYSQFSRRWFGFAKGGNYSPFYSDFYLLILWKDEGREIKAWADPLYGNSGWSRILKSVDFYFRPGLTWPLRTQSGLSIRALPAGSIFGHKGPSAFVAGDSSTQLLALLAIVNSSSFRALVNLQMAFGSYEVGVIQRTPVPDLSVADERDLAGLARQSWSLKRALDTRTETSHALSLPALLQVNGNTLEARASAWAIRVRMHEAELATLQAEIDARCFALYDISAADQQAITAGFGAGSVEAEGQNSDSADEEEEATDAESGTDVARQVSALVSWMLGAATGRFDIRLASGARALPPEPDPFAAFPVCPPGMLQNAEGLPVTPQDLPSGYPIPFPWDGILVDDPGHPRDLEARVQQVLQVIWKERDQAIEREACELLGVRSLREYFANFSTGKKAGFFDDHLKRYSKSRRTAPIYWPLSTRSGRYTLWVYYHRLTDQTLYICVNDFVDIKLRQVTDQANGLRYKSGRSSQEEAALERLLEDTIELTELRTELLRLAQFWKPDLNDGVQITAAPLWRLFAHRPWQKKLKETWESLEAGEYDWAHLALCIRSTQVREKCRTDKSLAIAHGLEHLYEAPPEPATKKRGKKQAPAHQASLFEGNSEGELP